MNRLLQAVTVVLVVCFGVRLAAWLIEPVLPAIGGLLVALFVLWWIVLGPRSGLRS